MKYTPPSKEFCLRIAELMFEGDFTEAEYFSWKYLFIWAMYDHWVELYWEEMQ